MHADNISPTTTVPPNSTYPLTADTAQFTSGVSWGAVLAGATASAALSLILLLLGMGFGLSSVSPWSGEGIGATALSLSSILWITFMSLAASAVGGYMAGRLRTKWVSLHTDEVYFRDTAHGLLAWAISTLAMATLLTSVAAGILGAGTRASAEVAGGVAAAAAGASGPASGLSDENTLDYFVDSLFRDRNTTTTQRGDDTIRESRETSTQEVSRIFINALAQDGNLPQADLDYIAQLVAQNTRLTQQQAEQRVVDVYNRTQEKLDEIETSVKEAADTAKKASAFASLWFSVALLIGAFVASLSATWGGRQRDL